MGHQVLGTKLKACGFELGPFALQIRLDAALGGRDHSGTKVTGVFLKLRGST